MTPEQPGRTDPLPGELARSRPAGKLTQSEPGAQCTVLPAFPRPSSPDALTGHLPLLVITRTQVCAAIPAADLLGHPPGPFRVVSLLFYASSAEEFRVIYRVSKLFSVSRSASQVALGRKELLPSWDSGQVLRYPRSQFQHRLQVQKALFAK